MRSNLTRLVFRRLLHNQPMILHSRNAQSNCLRDSFRHGKVAHRTQSIRTVMSMFKRPRRDLREPYLDPGMDKMLELDKRIHLVARLPPTNDLVRAFKDFVAAKKEQMMPVEDFHATKLIQTLGAINSQTAGNETQGLCYEDMLDALRLLRHRETNITATHAELARMLYKGLRRNAHKYKGKHKEHWRTQQLLMPYAIVLSQSGNALEARDLVCQACRDGVHMADNVWASLIQAFAQAGQENDVLITIQLLDELDVKIGPETRRVVTLYYAARNDVDRTKVWYDESILLPREADGLPKGVTGATNTSDKIALKALVEFSLRNDEMQWATKALAVGNDYDPAPGHWVAIFQAAAISGKSVDDISRMISVMSKRSKENGKDGIPPIETFNGLMELAVEENDAYSAERYFVLAERWGATPNAKTYILQVDYRLAAKDYDGAQRAYASLRDQPIVANEDWDIMNKLLQTLIVLPRTSHELIMGLVEDLSERKRIFPVETIKALCVYHVNRNEYLEVVDLLQTYSFQLGTAQRINICDLLVSIALDPTNNDGRCWDVYMIFHQVFDIEARRDSREKVMVELYRRHRPDLATHVFTRMSKHVRADTRPDANTYVSAFEGIAASGEPEALEVVHNILKLDTETELNTRLRNALMLAYTEVDVPWRSLEFWDEIAHSEEGPTYESLHIAFRACEKSHMGHEMAESIWTRLLESDIELSTKLFASYIGALAGNERFDAAAQAIQRTEEITGKPPDNFIIGTFFNASHGVLLQAKIEEWAKDNYHDVWHGLVSKGMREHETGVRALVSIDRTLHA